MVHFNAVLASVAALAVQATQAQLAKPALRNDLNALWPQLQQRLRSPAPSQFTTLWPPGTIADGCLALARRENLNPTLIDTYEIKWEDCGQSWLVCKHRNNPINIGTVQQLLGQTPVRLRQWVKDILISDQPGGAYALGNQVVFFGNPNTIGVYLHEITHTADFSSAFATPNQWLGNQPVWQTAYDADSAVPDNYARTNQIENVAQFPGFALYDAVVPGGSVTVEPNVARIGNQLRVFKDQAARADNGGDMLGQATSCSRRFANSVPVPQVANARLSAEAAAFIESRSADAGAPEGVVRLAAIEEVIEATNCTGYV